MVFACSEAVSKAWMDMPAHLRPAPSPTDMGCLPNYTTQMARCLKRPVELAVDPKWSTELFNMNEWLACGCRVTSSSCVVLCMDYRLREDVLACAWVLNDDYRTCGSC